MMWIAAGLALAGWIVALLLLALLPGRARRRATQSALRLRSHVEPYLRRRLQEINKGAEASDPSQDPQRLVDHLCELADRLTEHERAQISVGDTLNMAHSDTMPIDTGDIEKAEAEAKKK
jgi:uncharacterized membrane-anchored protein YhcB (DUF1043 family)